MMTKLTVRQGLIGGLTALVIGGAVFGMTVANPGLPIPFIGTASAQTTNAAGSGGGQPDQRWQNILSKMASILHLDTSTVQSALTQSEKAVVDEDVAANRLTSDQGNALKARIDQSGGRPFFRGGEAGRFHGPGQGPSGQASAAGQQGQGERGQIFAAAAQAVGLTTDQLMAQFKAGKTLSQIATDQKVDPAVVKQKLTTALQGEFNNRLSQRVDFLMTRQFGAGRLGPQVVPSPSPTH